MPSQQTANLPDELLPPQTSPDRWRVLGKKANLRFALGAISFFVTVMVLAVTQSPFSLLGFAFAGVILVLGFVQAARAIWRSLDEHENPYEMGPRTWIAVFPYFGGGMMLLGFLYAVLGSMGFSRGRQLRRFGRVLLPPVENAGAWAHLKVGEDLARELAPEVRAAIADRWRENGRTEHASVAAFAHHTLGLVALGAPPKLIEDANRDARDEIRHSELCFSLARAIDGREAGPGAFPAAQTHRALPSNRGLALAQLAVDSLVEGTMYEGLSARVIAQLAKRCHQPAIRAVLLELAADEGRHAAHGWDVVEWCLSEGGAPVALALAGAAAALRGSAESDLPKEARAGAWEQYGIHGADLENSERSLTRDHVVARVAKLVRVPLRGEARAA